MKLISNRTALVSVAVTIIVAALIVLSVPRQVYVQFIASRLGSAFAESGVLIDFEGVSSSGLRTITAEKAVVLFTRLLLSLELKETQLSIHPLSLVKLHIDSSLNAKAYDGEVKGTSSNSLLHDSGLFSASAKNIQISSIPLLSLLGFTDGSLSFELSELLVNNGFVAKCAASFALQDLEKGKETPSLPFISSLVSSLNIPYSGPIPPFKKVQLSGEVSLDNSILSFQEVHIKTAEGSLSAKGTAKISPSFNTIFSCDCRFEVSLSPEGTRTLGAFLPLITQGKVKAQTQRFTMAIKGTPTKENLTFSTP